MRGEGTSNRGSPSSLFSAPSSPTPIPSQPPAPPPHPLSLPPSMPSSSRSNVAGPSRRPPAPGTQVRFTRKPNWLIQPKIKRFDAPNLKPSSSLPTKASLSGAATTSEVPQSPTSVRSSTQTPTIPHPSFMLEEPSGVGQGSDVDALQQSYAHSPTEPEVPLLPPASMAETEAFLGDIMPPECVLQPSLCAFGLLSLFLRMSEPMMYDAYQTFVAAVSLRHHPQRWRRGQSPSRTQVVDSRYPQVSASILWISWCLKSGRNTHFSRKYKWNGELCINTEKGHKERVCNVSLSESSDGSPDRLRFSICFNSSVSSLLLEKLFSLAELQCLRPALTPVAEVAKLGPESEADMQPLNTLFIHMSSRKLACPYPSSMNELTDVGGRCHVLPSVLTTTKLPCSLCFRLRT